MVESSCWRDSPSAERINFRRCPCEVAPPRLAGILSTVTAAPFPGLQAYFPTGSGHSSGWHGVGGEEGAAQVEGTKNRLDREGQGGGQAFPGQVDVQSFHKRRLVDSEPAPDYHRPNQGEAPGNLHHLVRQMPAALADDGLTEYVPAAGRLENHPGPLSPVASVVVGVEVADQLLGVFKPALGQQQPCELVRRKAQIVLPEAVAYSFPSKPVTAAFVAQQVAPAPAPGFFTGRVDSPDGGARAGDQCNPDVMACCCQDQSGVVDNFL